MSLETHRQQLGLLFALVLPCFCIVNASCDDGTSDIHPERFDINASLSPAIATVGIVEWTFDGEAEAATIEFGLTEAYEMSAPVDLSEPSFRTLLLGMKPSTEYHFEIRVTSGGTLVRSGDNTLTTGPVINGLNPPNLTASFPEDRVGGFFVFGMFNEGTASSIIACILDADGDYVWWHEASIPNVARARMTFDGKYMVLVPVSSVASPGAMELVSMDGTWSEVLDMPNVTHDWTPTPDNEVAFISVDKQNLEPEPCGTIEVFSPTLSTETEVVFDTSTIWEPPCHANALRYSATEDIFTLSDLIHDQIIGISRNGEHLWTANPNGDLWTMQHGHHLTDDHLIVFTNQTSEVLMFPFDDELVETPSWSYSSIYSTMHLGDVQQLPNDNLVVTYAEDGIIREVSPDGEPVQTFSLGQNVPGYVSWRETLYGPPDDIYE